MRGKELYQHLLGLTSPWHVVDVELDTSAQEIRVQVDQPHGLRRLKNHCCASTLRSFIGMRKRCKIRD